VDIKDDATEVIWSADNRKQSYDQFRIWKKIPIEKILSIDHFVFQDLVSGKYLSTGEYDTPTGIEGNYDMITLVSRIEVCSK
jgi:hypothetical protein